MAFTRRQKAVPGLRGGIGIEKKRAVVTQIERAGLTEGGRKRKKASDIRWHMEGAWMVVCFCNSACGFFSANAASSIRAAHCVYKPPQHHEGQRETADVEP